LHPELSFALALTLLHRRPIHVDAKLKKGQQTSPPLFLKLDTLGYCWTVMISGGFGLAAMPV
jgi:hypothetical protein